MAVPRWRGQVIGGHLHFDRRRDFDTYAATLDGKRFDLVLRPEVKHKSNSQRAYLHVLLDEFAAFCGRSLAETKAIVKLKFLWDGESVDRFGLPVVPSTEELTMERYAKLIDDTQRLMAECDCPFRGSDEIEA